jgi:hypothetical protein
MTGSTFAWTEVATAMIFLIEELMNMNITACTIKLRVMITAATETTM